MTIHPPSCITYMIAFFLKITTVVILLKKYLMVFCVWILWSKHLGCCSTFKWIKNTNLVVRVFLRFSKVSQYPACLDHSILHGKPFAISLIPVNISYSAPEIKFFVIYDQGGGWRENSEVTEKMNMSWVRQKKNSHSWSSIFFYMSKC